MPLFINKRPVKAVSEVTSGLTTLPALRVLFEDGEITVFDKKIFLANMEGAIEGIPQCKTPVAGSHRITYEGTAPISKSETKVSNVTNTLLPLSRGSGMVASAAAPAPAVTQPPSDSAVVSEKEMAALAAILSITKDLSNKEFRNVLTMASSMRSLRVVPAGVPIGNPKGKEKEKKPSNKKGPSPAAWKKDPRWVAAESRHATIVANVKTDAPNRASHQADLRQLESEMKTLKRELQGKGR